VETQKLPLQIISKWLRKRVSLVARPWVWPDEDTSYDVDDLKGNNFVRAENATISMWALAFEEMLTRNQN
jgi:hypothetical protein